MDNGDPVRRRRRGASGRGGTTPQCGCPVPRGCEKPIIRLGSGPPRPRRAGHGHHRRSHVPGFRRPGRARGLAPLAVREGPYRHGTLRRRRVLGLAAGRADRDRGSDAAGRRRGSVPDRADLAEAVRLHAGPRHDRRGRQRRHHRHRAGALGPEGQGAGHAGLEPAGRQDARPHPAVRPRVRRGTGARAGRPRLHGDEALRLAGRGEPRAEAAQRVRAGDRPDGRCRRRALADAGGRDLAGPASGALRPAVLRGSRLGRGHRRSGAGGAGGGPADRDRRGLPPTCSRCAR